MLWLFCWLKDFVIHCRNSRWNGTFIDGNKGKKLCTDNKTHVYQIWKTTAVTLDQWSVSLSCSFWMNSSPNVPEANKLLINKSCQNLLTCQGGSSVFWFRRVGAEMHPKVAEPWFRFLWENCATIWRSSVCCSLQCHHKVAHILRSAPLNTESCIRFFHHFLLIFIEQSSIFVKTQVFQIATQTSLHHIPKKIHLALSWQAKF